MSGRRKAAEHGDERRRAIFRVDGQGHDTDVAIHRARKKHEAGDGQRHNEKVDRQEIDGKDEGGGANVAFLAIFHHGDMELARQEHHCAARKQGQRDPDRHVRRRREHGADARTCAGALEQVAQSVEHAPDDKGADRDESQELHHRFRGDRQHQAVLMLAGVDAAGAEDHGEAGKRQSDAEGDAIRPLGRRCDHWIDRAETRGQRRGNRLELQGDIGHDADHRNHCRDRRHCFRLAIAGGKEVGDGSGVLRVGEPRHPRHHRPAEAEHQHGPDIDRQEIQAVRRSQAHRAEKGPGGAIDAKSEGIDDFPRDAPAKKRAVAVAIGGERQQGDKIG
jgi:hypothetical protein